MLCQTLKKNLISRIQVTIGSKEKGGRLDGTALLLRMAKLHSSVPLAHSNNPGTFINTLVVGSLLQPDEEMGRGRKVELTTQSEGQRAQGAKPRPPPVLTHRDKTPPPPEIGCFNGPALALTPPRGTDAEAGLVAFSPHANNLWKTPRHLADQATSSLHPEAGGEGGGAGVQGPMTPAGQWLLGSELARGLLSASSPPPATVAASGQANKALR